MTLRTVLVFCLLSCLIPGSLLALSVKSGSNLNHHAKTSEPGAPMTATPCTGGMAGPYPCYKIDLLAFVPVANMGCTTSGSGNTVEGWTDSLTGKEYALMGCSNGVSFLDVSDPVNPLYLGRLPGHNGSTSLWRDIRVYNSRAYVGSEASGHGIQVFDLTRLRGVITPQTFTEDAHYAGLGNSHTIYINPNTGFLYAVGSGGGSNVCPSGLHMINVQSPTPVFAGCFGSGIYTHETTCVTYNGPDTTYAGHELCFNANGPTEQLVIVDVTNKGLPVQISATGYTGSNYPHQVWLTEDQTHLLLDDELDESAFGHPTTTYIWDISDLNNPVLVNNFVHSTFSIDHNLYVKGNYVYESNYQAGLRILDLTNVASGTLNEVAFFDVWPYGDAADFEGTWDNYPYLPSGILLVTGIFNPAAPNPPNVAGLFILQEVLTPDFDISADPTTLNACGNGAAETNLQLGAINGYSGNVNLSATGLPAGAGINFTPNPVTVPGSSLAQITLSGTPAGNYPFTVTAADATVSHDAALTLNVASGIPSAPVLLNPPDNTPDELFIVHYEWLPVAGASSYDLEISTAPDFSSILYSANVVLDHHTATLTLDPLTTYYWRVRANNACGASSNSVTFQFTTRAPAEILLVDDDDNDPDIVSAYASALTTLGRTYDMWDTLIQTIANSPDHLNEPDAATMSQYNMVIWASGDASGGSLAPLAGPSESSETALTTYLNNGGCLLLSSQDYFSDRGNAVNPFMTDYLGMNTASNNVFQTNVTGTGIFSGLGGFQLSFPQGFTNHTDRVFPSTAPGVQSAFNGNAGNAAISKDGGAYRTIYFGFPFEVMGNAAGRANVMERAWNFCAGLHQPDLLVTLLDSPDPVMVGDQLTYTATVTNLSLVNAPGSVLTDTLPAGVTLISAGATQGSGCTGTTTVTCDLGTVTAGSPVTVTIVVVPTVDGVLSNAASVSGTLTDSNPVDNSATITTQSTTPSCLFCDDFNDGVPPSWAFGKGSWQEASGNLTGAYSRKTSAVASPVFGGCTQCAVEARMQTAGGTGNRVSVLGWYVDKKNGVELMMKEESDRWILKQRSGGTVIAKAKADGTILPGVTYTARIVFDGSTFSVSIDGSPLITLPAAAAPSGTVGFQVKATTGTFDEIRVD